MNPNYLAAGLLEDGKQGADWTGEPGFGSTAYALMGSSIIDHAREIAELVKKYNDLDLYEKIVALREEILALREKNLELDEQVRNLRKAANQQLELERRGNLYFRKGDSDEKEPFCIPCWDYESKLIGVIRNSNGYFDCKICSARMAKRA